MNFKEKNGMLNPATCTTVSATWSIVAMIPKPVGPRTTDRILARTIPVRIIKTWITPTEMRTLDILHWPVSRLVESTENEPTCHHRLEKTFCQILVPDRESRMSGGREYTGAEQLE